MKFHFRGNVSHKSDVDGCMPTGLNTSKNIALTFS